MNRVIIEPFKIQNHIPSEVEVSPTPKLLTKNNKNTSHVEKLRITKKDV